MNMFQPIHKSYYIWKSGRSFSVILYITDKLDRPIYLNSCFLFIFIKNYDKHEDSSLLGC